MCIPNLAIDSTWIKFINIYFTLAKLPQNNATSCKLCNSNGTTIIAPNRDGVQLTMNSKLNAAARAYIQGKKE